MVGKNIILIILSALFIISSCDSVKDAPNHHALVIMSHHNALQGSSNLVDPFEVNMMALNLLKTEDNQQQQDGKSVIYEGYVRECGLYIQWYLNHVNPGDQYGLTGTIYRYYVDKKGLENPQPILEEIDRTAASFILLVCRYYQVTGYSRVLQQSRKKIENIVYLIPHLSDPADNLIRNMPVADRKLLENNCLDLAALDAYIELDLAMDWGKADYYRGVRDALKNAILSEFYRQNQGEFYWKIEGKDKTRKKFAVDWDNVYPDAYAQLFPVLYAIFPPKRQQEATRLWEKFTNLHRRVIHKRKTVQRIIFQWTAAATGDVALDKDEKIKLVKRFSTHPNRPRS